MGSLFYDYFHTGQMTDPYTYLVEGIGEDFMPSTIDFQYIDDVVRVNDAECFHMTRRIVREEGIFAGGSSGAAVAGALKWVSHHDEEGLNVLVLLPDSGSRYLSKVFNDKWMEENGFLESGTSFGSVGEMMKLRGGSRDLITVSPNSTVSEVVGVMKLHGVSQVPVIEDEQLLGVLTETALLQRALSGFRPNKRVRELAEANYTTVDVDTEVSVLVELFKRAKVAFVMDDHKVADIITRIDLIDYISSVTSGVDGPAK